MFKNPTVFVLGAGASWHYGYPTGERLIERMEDMAEAFSRFYRMIMLAPTLGIKLPGSLITEQRLICEPSEIVGVASSAKAECEMFAERLRTVRPLVIDYFLEWNESLREIGKVLIAASILECEAKFKSTGQNANRTQDDISQHQHARHDDWIRFLVHKLAYDCKSSNDLLKNKVSFVTFNYDSSLESRLQESLNAIDIFGPNEIEQFLAPPRIVHVYGSIPQTDTPLSIGPENILAKGSVELFQDRLSQLQRAPTDHTAHFVETMNRVSSFIDLCYTASQHIMTINSVDKHLNIESISNSRNNISSAQVIYILGYGFDPLNSERIGLSAQTQRNRAIMFTNYGNINVINKRASKLFAPGFLHNDLDIIGDLRSNYWERSRRDVYGALSVDFDALESELIAGRSI